MIKLNKKYQPLFKSKKRYFIVTGGRGSAKSFSVNTFLTLLTYESNQKILFTRYTMTSAEISIIPEFKEKIEMLNVEKVFDVQARGVTNLLSGNQVLFRGIKTSSGTQTANLKSINGVSCFVVDEAEEFTDEESFDKIDLSVRTNNAQNRVIMILNPPSKDHFIWRRWFENNHRIEMIDGIPVEICTHPDVEHIHTTYFDNIENLNESAISVIHRMKENSLRIYANKAVGQWLDIAEGSLFMNLKTYRPTNDLEFESSFAYIDSADDGNDFLCCVVGRTIGSKIYITEFVFTDQNTDVSIPLCVDALKRNKVSHCRIESNSMGSLVAKIIRKEVPTTMILPVHSSSNKQTRILNDSVQICEYFHFIHESDRSAMYHAAIGQLRQYTKDGKAKNDDVADACSGLMTFIRSMLSKLF